MRKQIWVESSSALRKVLRKVPMDNSMGDDIFVAYKFGLCYLPSNNLHYIYNGMVNNVIATVKVGDKVILRYRPSSHYSSVLEHFTYDKETIHIASPNLRRSRGVIRSRLGDEVHRAIMERREERRRQRLARQVELESTPDRGSDLLLADVQMSHMPDRLALRMRFLFSNGEGDEWGYTIEGTQDDAVLMDRFGRMIDEATNSEYNTLQLVSKTLIDAIDNIQERGVHTFSELSSTFEAMGGMNAIVNGRPARQRPTARDSEYTIHHSTRLENFWGNSQVRLANQAIDTAEPQNSVNNDYRTYVQEMQERTR